MTTWRSPRLDVGVYGLPWPAVLVAPWQLSARVNEPEDLPMSAVCRPEDWDMLLPHPWARLSIAEDTGLVLHLGPNSPVPLYLADTREPGWDDTAQSLGRAIVATTDLGDYWRLIDHGNGSPGFDDVFPPGSQAMLVEFAPAT